MAKVKAIKNIEQVWAFEERLTKRHKKWGMMFTVLMFTGLRVSDVLKLRIKDLTATRLEIIEQKTDKVRDISIPMDLRKEVKKYAKEFNLKPDDYLVFSRKHDGDGNIKAVSRVQAYRVIKEIAESMGLEHVGCHSTRKTFGYFEYQETKDIVRLQMILNHSSYKTTLRYIGIEEEEVDDATNRAFDRFKKKKW